MNVKNHVRFFITKSYTSNVQFDDNLGLLNVRYK